jgi:hypothetical protein
MSIGLIVLLGFVTLANGGALWLGIDTWYDEASQGGEIDDLPMLAAVVTTFGAVIALTGIAATWFRRKWGPPLYAGVQAAAFLFVLVAAPEALGLLNFVPLLLAGLLWWLANSDTNRDD